MYLIEIKSNAYKRNLSYYINLIRTVLHPLLYSNNNKQGGCSKEGPNSHIMGPKSDKPMPLLQGLPGAGLKQYKTNMSNREI